jgi:hypothetical protein
VAGPLADPAVDHHVVVRAEAGLALVDGFQLGAAPEGGVLGRGAGPRDALSPGDVAAAQRALLGIVGHVQQVAAVLAGRAHVDHGLAEVAEDLLLERAEPGVVTVDRRVVGGRGLGGVGADRAALSDPLGPPAVHQAHVPVPEQRAHPQRVGGPPVVLVPVEDQRGVPADPLLRHQPGEPRSVHVVPGHRVVELGVPVQLDRAGNVPGLVEQHVLVGFGHHQAGVVEVVRDPLGGDDHLRVGVLLELRRGILR